MKELIYLQREKEGESTKAGVGRAGKMYISFHTIQSRWIEVSRIKEKKGGMIARKNSLNLHMKK